MNRGFWIGLALGVPVMLYGIRGVVIDASLTHPAEWGRWLVLSAFVHDLLVVPVVLVAGWLAGRAVPASAWPAVRWGLFTTAILTVVFWPYARGYGRNATIPSLLNRNYAAGLLVYIAITWCAVAAVIIGRHARAPWRRARRRAREGPPT